MLVDTLKFINTATVVNLQKEKLLTQPGTLVPLMGNVRWYPRNTIKLQEIDGYVGTPSTGASIVFVLKKNGNPVSPSVIIQTTQYKSNLITLNDVIVEPTDYLTVDVLQVGSIVPGSDLVVRIIYRE